MATVVTMPKLGTTMMSGVILKWLKKEGERVEKGEPLLEIQTDKVNMEEEAYESGVLLKILAPEGTEVPVNQPIAVIGVEDEDISSSCAKFQVNAASRRKCNRRGSFCRKRGDGRRFGPCAWGRKAQGYACGEEARQRIWCRPCSHQGKRPTGQSPQGGCGGTPQAGCAQTGRSACRCGEANGSSPWQGHSALRHTRRYRQKMRESVNTAPHYFVFMEIDMSEALKVRSASM